MTPNLCPRCPRALIVSGHRSNVVKFGFFRRACDGKKQQRYRCNDCGSHFSEATFSLCYRQKRRDLNPIVFTEIASCVSQRRLAMNFCVARKTVERKFKFLGRICRALLDEDLFHFPLAKEIQFDDLVTHEHTKLKPVSVLAVVENKSRRVLGFTVARAPSNGLLAKKSRAKYGRRPDERKTKRDNLFSALSKHVEPDATLFSDQHGGYAPSVRAHFPGAKHLTYKGRRGCVVGQGELKAGGFDDLFSINHTFAMFRDNANRLRRKTWATTKTLEGLESHIAIYCLFHNWRLITKNNKQRRARFKQLMN